MKLREYLYRRMRPQAAVFFANFFILWVLAAIAPQSPWTDRAWGLLALSFTALAIQNYRARCPNCNARLSYIDFGSRRFGREPTLGLDGCASCGLHLEDEIAVKPNGGAMKMNDGRNALQLTLGWAYALAAIVMLAAGLWLLYVAHEAAENAVRVYGHSVDSGVLESIVVVCYFFLNAVLWALAALSIWLRWKPLGRWFFPCLAAFWMIFPVAMVCFGWL
jgi:hypothetical protein